MARSPRNLLLALAAVLMLPALGVAQAGPADPLIPKTKGPVRTVGLFNFLCLKQLPDLEGVERAAGFGEFDQLTGDDLKPYAPKTPAERAFAWRYHDHGEEFVLTAMRSKPDAAITSEKPAFANATSSACSLFVPSLQPDPLLGELTRVLGRAAEQTRLEGAMRVHTWTHQQNDALSYVRYYVPEKVGTRAILSAVVLVKN